MSNEIRQNGTACYYGSDGSFKGFSSPDGGSGTVFYNSDGSYAGNSINSGGGNVTYYSNDGSLLGFSISTDNNGSIFDD